MRRISIILSALLIIGNLAAEAQHSTTSSGRNNRRHTTEQTAPQKRPDNKNHRPGNNHNTPPRPRPENRPQQPPVMRPQPTHRPSVQPPHRPTPPRPILHRPAPPVRPVGWYHRPGAPTVGQILGLTLGSLFATAIDNLTAHNVSYTPCGNDVINVTNAMQFGYQWPQASLYYSQGHLVGGQFEYYGGISARNRYNALADQFTASWGQPYSAAGTQLTWFTPDNGYVSLHGGYSGSNWRTTLTIGH